MHKNVSLYYIHAAYSSSILALENEQKDQNQWSLWGETLNILALYSIE